MFLVPLRAMAMNQFFRCFSINRFGLGPLHYRYLPSRPEFGFEFSGIRKSTPRIGESGSRQDCQEYPLFQTFK
jgi:hypothetical protein